MTAINFGPGQAWWWPLPRDGETVPDHPPVSLGAVGVGELEINDQEGDTDATTG